MPLKRYSTFMTTRLGLATAVHSKAEIFLLEEVLAVGDQSFRLKGNDWQVKDGETVPNKNSCL